LTRYEGERLARVGNYLSLVGGLVCALFGTLLIGWLASLLYLGILITLTTFLQRMTYKTFASVLTVIFSICYLIVWWLMTSSISTIFNLHYMGLVGSLFGIIGGTISAFSTRAL